MNLSPELIGVGIGGLISLVTALLITFVSNYYQNKREKQNRQWQIEDTIKERKRNIFAQRAKDVELYIEAIHNSFDAFYKNIATAAAKGEITDESIGHIRSAVDFSNQALRLRSALIYFDDQQLKDASNELQSLLVEIGNYWIANKDELLKEDLDMQGMSNYLSGIKAKLSAIQAKMLKRIDEMYNLI